WRAFPARLSECRRARRRPAPGGPARRLPVRVAGALLPPARPRLAGAHRARARARRAAGERGSGCLMSATANPTGLLADPAMGFLAPALEPEPALAAFRRPGGPLADLDGPVRIARIDILRHKPGRRCLIAYDIDVAPRHGAPQSFTLLGKARAKGLDRHAL